MLRRGRGVFQKIPRGEKVKEEVFERNTGEGLIITTLRPYVVRDPCVTPNPSLCERGDEKCLLAGCDYIPPQHTKPIFYINTVSLSLHHYSCHRNIIVKHRHHSNDDDCLLQSVRGEFVGKCDVMSTMMAALFTSILKLAVSC